MSIIVTSLNNYEISDNIHESSRTLVYRGQNKSNFQPVIIKLLRTEFPSFNELVQFRNQYTITKNLQIEGIVKPLALERYQNSYALIMEDFGGISLDEYYQNFSPPTLDISQFIDIAIKITEIIDKLHQNRIIHKDIKPSNILINPETQQVKIIDFSISTLLPKETPTIQTPNVLEGTLGYISPEQTGRMNRGIDYRSDFYSLGVTFFEMLNGKLPFETTDPMELVHCHITKTPPTLNSELPSALVDIVLKLMAKNAEDRYQSALGLKYDLEQCLIQWQEKRKIEAFELGSRDISYCFIIPEKLYGRDAEVQQLLAAFERVAIPPQSPLGKRGSSELILVAGFSGIGKTAIVNEVHKPIVKQRGYFIKGKFDQFNRNIPFSALVQSLRDLMGQLLSESDAQLQEWKDKILDAVGENGKVIIDVIPELERIIGNQPAVPELSGSAAQNRFNLLFGKFIQVFTAQEHPLVIFLDDLQWADSASLNLMKLLVSEASNSYLLMIGAYRDNEVFPAHPLMLTLDEMRKAEATINTITLTPLSEANINHLVADTLSCDGEMAKPLTELVYQKTKGNPFFTTQFLLGLHGDELISFNVKVGYWECDITEVRQRALTDDVVEFMAGRLQKLPTETQEVLKLAACIGNQFDLATLAIVYEKSKEDTADSLWKALQEGFILPQSEVYKFYLSRNDASGNNQNTENAQYRFLHDRVQQATYSLISEYQKQATHLKIGHQLWQNLPESQQETRLFSIVNHLNIGCDLIVEKLEREELARLNLQASQKAKVSAAYEASLRYCYVGKSFLSSESWQTNYSLCFELAITTIEAEYLCYNLPIAKQLAEETLKYSKTLLERVKVYELQILFKINQNQMNEAISQAIDVLELLEINIPKGVENIQAEISSIRQEINLPTEEIANLANCEQLEDEGKLAAIRILTNATSAAYLANPTLYPAIVFHTVRQCMKFGNSPLATSAYVWYGALLCGVYDEIDAGYEFGKLAILLLEQFNARAFATKVREMFNVFIRPWKEHLSASIAALPEVIQTGFDNGDLEYAFYGVVAYCNYLFYGGNFLETVCQTQERYLPEIVKAKSEFNEGFLRIYAQVVVNLLGKTDDPQSLQGSILDEQKCLPQWQASNIVFLVFCFYEAQTRLAYLFGNIPKALSAAEYGWQYRQASRGTLYLSEYHFYYSLALLSEKYLTSQQRDRIAENQTQLKTWAKFSPANFQHKYELVEAENMRLLGKLSHAIELYDSAIAGAKENEYIQEEALANELAAKFYLDWGKEKIAATYMQEAYYCYARWGAKAKTDDLEKRYPHLLIPILEKQKLSLISSDTLISLTQGTISPTSTGAGEILDLATLMKASRTLSKDISLDGAIVNLMQVVKENAGAEIVALLLLQDSVLMLTALVTDKEVSICTSQTVASSDSVPLSIVNQVKHRQKPLVLDNASNNNVYASDTYIQKHQPQSVLCLPLIDRGNTIGILYLENNQLSGAFTRERVEVLSLLCSQAAISLENARLYQESQNYAQQLEQTQLQLVQSDKMATIGQLTAGVAHEINNPVGFIGGNLDYATEYVQDLMDLLQLYEQGFEHNSQTIQNKIEEIELDYLRADLPELIESMKAGTKRITEISKSMRSFSRTDTIAKTKFNIHDGIDSTLLILRHRLKANEVRPEIQVVKNYGNLPEINCYPGQLNQVFMNLIANGIDALDESNVGKNFDEIQAAPNQITITTEIDQEQEQVMIKIRDNGMGMSEEVKDKIFGHLFTTKGVGKGTGLGLSISRQIVEEKHGGKITCISELGTGTEFTISLPKN
ncbi:trifunctional serine/threonine-protein kinase/ATP-binding protein/sensor histidine kinase [Dapis sp. BLCC M126]|uniref:trifunctional serine/threonine-protein kinase/ATP-binding protein/sensor histidine kinase n=1 Tax=Dapis sp. BLCC M126 TaxID=3400189 RepID=UPI003CEBE181